MKGNIKDLAHKFEAKLEAKTAAKRGQKMNAKKIHRELDKARKDYKESSKRLQLLESQLAAIEGQIQDCRDGRRTSRSKMLNYNRVLQNMDLSDARYAVFYDSDDVGYIIDGDENYLDLTDDGEVSLQPMKEWRRAQRKALRDQNQSDDEDKNKEISHEELEEEERKSNKEDEKESTSPPENSEKEDDNSADDYDGLLIRNFRFLD